MSIDQLKPRIRKFIEEHFPLARARSLTDGESLLDGGIIDSLGVLDLVEFLEAEFEVVPTDSEVVADNFETIEGIAAFVHSKTQPENESTQ